MAARDRYDLRKIRKQIKKKLHKERDPNEFRPAKAEGNKTYKYRFIVLGPIEAGDMIADGEKADQTMEEFFITDGAHYLEGKRFGCPRAINDDNCEVCEYGFDLMSETDDKAKRSEIAKKLLASQYYKVNIYFLPHKNNPTPDELVGRVMWFNSPKTVFDKWWECLCRDDDGGDPDEPEAHGVFFDELSSYVFQLHVKQKGLGNSYEESKFLATKGTIPIAKKDKKIDEEKIAEIMAKRHNLWAKLPDINMAELSRLASNLSGGAEDSDGGGFDKDETKDQKDKDQKDKDQKDKDAKAKKEKAEKAKAKKAKDTKAKKDTKVKKDEDDEVIDEDDDVVDDDDIADEAPFEEGDEKSGDEVVDNDSNDDAEVDDLLDQLVDGDDD